MSRYLFLLVLMFVLPGCKLAVMVVEGGAVHISSEGTCQAGMVCLREIETTTYYREYTAVPDPGWRFVRWYAGEEFACADSTDPVCVIAPFLFAGNPLIEAIVASDDTYYMMPVFEEVGLPVTDVVVVDGVTWAQPALFRTSCWDEINEACPGGGPCGGIVSGYDMTGWSWAGVEELNAMFNSFGVEPALKGPDRVDLADSPWAPEIFRAGFLPTETESTGAPNRIGVYGYLNELTPAGSARAGSAIDNYDPTALDRVVTNGNIGRSCGGSPLSFYGGWFYSTR